MQRTIVFTPGNTYHAYNRGVDRRPIFIDEFYYRRFMLLLYLCNGTEPVNVEQELKKGRSFFELWDSNTGMTLVDIGAYCLMPNHYHILLQEKTQGGVSRFMKKLGTAYSMYFNNKQQRSGSLFEGRFKAQHADTDEYLKYLFAYIHLNPVKLINPDWKEDGIANKTTAQQHLQKYYWSSYIDYMGARRPEGKILNTGAFPDYFNGTKRFKEYVDDWLFYHDE